MLGRILNQYSNYFYLFIFLIGQVGLYSRRHPIGLNASLPVGCSTTRDAHVHYWDLICLEVVTPVQDRRQRGLAIQVAEEM